MYTELTRCQHGHEKRHFFPYSAFHMAPNPSMLFVWEPSSDLKPSV